MYITKYGCVFLKVGESIYMYVAMDLIPILLGLLPLAHNAQHSLVKGNVAVYKVLNLEMLLYKVRWHVSTVKECNLIARS